jgi:putative membrane protein
MRHHALLGYLTGLPLFAAYFGLALLLLALFVFVYIRITPYREIALIRSGNVAAAASLGGSMIGFVLPVASSIENSVSLIDMLLWSLVALVVQLLAFVIARAMVPQISKNVEEGQVASGVFLGAVGIALGLLNAACMTY